MKKSATFSECRTWRYTLERVWDEGKGNCTFIGLNPSTADETKDDRTISRCIDFARAWGFGSLTMLNLFALRSTWPIALYKHPDPVGPDNDLWISVALGNAARVVCAWGNHGKLHGRAKHVLEFFNGDGIAFRHFGLTKQGQPIHPLYQRKDAKLEYLKLDGCVAEWMK
jgi:hypothetical protein